MIGFTVQARLFDGEGNDRLETIVLSLDTDAVEVDGKPMLDVRMAGDDTIIANVDVEDLYEAVNEVRRQFDQWGREQQKVALVDA